MGNDCQAQRVGLFNPFRATNCSELRLACPSANRSANSTASRSVPNSSKCQIRRPQATAKSRGFRSLACPVLNSQSSIGTGSVHANHSSIVISVQITT